MDSSPSSGEAVMAALLHPPPRAFSDLTRSLATDLSLQRRHIYLLLLSPFHFSRTLAHLHSLSLPEKTLLLGRLLLHHLHLLFPSLSGGGAAAHHLHLRDFDAALLLMAMCDAYDSNHPHADWRGRIAEHVVAAALSPAGLGNGGWTVLGHYVDAAAKCRRLFEVVSGGGEGGGGGGGSGGGGGGAAIGGVPEAREGVRDMQGGDGGGEGRVRAAVRALVPLGLCAGVVEEEEHLPLLPV
uniref:LOW QUALITY PROTEIN: E3 ubiquitin-protein ligase SGR9, amyloplastic n=1 Tax=Elaeis guineensis var. tenera TaxID=51953 RepID=A0A6J0PR49_ELAGV|nr:LOW QUALITY PROTEIN: E3 ubiquitin-protein ligase SGR9, amyloplastic [Elaeis guineensis]